jgi:hypothetical protein
VKGVGVVGLGVLAAGRIAAGCSSERGATTTQPSDPAAGLHAPTAGDHHIDNGRELT